VVQRQVRVADGRSWAKWLPGVVLAAALAVLGRWLARGLSAGVATLSGLNPAAPDSQNLVSGVAVAVVLGLVFRNIGGLPDACRPGIGFVTKTGLRAGIVLLGFKLAVVTAGQITGTALPVVAASIAAALLVTMSLSRLVAIPAKLGALIAAGTSICGVTAIVGLGAAIDASEDETSYAVACITLFGLLALFTYPWAAHAAFGSSPLLAGVFLGTSIHDTSQVTGASLIYQEAYAAPAALQAATVTKLIRNVFMAVLIPFIATRFQPGRRALTARGLAAALPGFVLAFLVAVVLRTVGDVVLAAQPAQGGVAGGLASTWRSFLDGTGIASAWALATALAGVGLTTDLRRLRALGWRPLAVGLAAALSVGVVSAACLSALAARLP
jgi:uncharacterized integral membrane protein (TIGR00698 family)